VLVLCLSDWIVRDRSRRAGPSLSNEGNSVFMGVGFLAYLLNEPSRL